MAMIKIQVRIIELEAEIKVMENKPKRFRQFKHDEEIASLYGEIRGLKWSLNHCFNESEPNLIEQ